MRSAVAFLVLAALPAGPACARSLDFAGSYRLVEDHDAAGQLIIHANGRFDYGLAYGALDEEAHGHWRRQGTKVCLYSEPKPVPPAFARASAEQSAGQEATVRVVSPQGRGIAGVDFRIGFDSGDPVTGYTQEDGFTLDPGEHRAPRWIEVYEPIYRIAAPRFELQGEDKGRLLIVLTPNDMGMVDLTGACLEATGNGIVLHRKEGDMHFARSGRARR